MSEPTETRAEYDFAERWLTVSELFGTTLQGEGLSQGMPAMFLRLGLCNLDCKWCDTPFTWDWTGKNGFAYSRAIELRRMQVVEVYDRLREGNPPELIVVSGGEPMLQQRSLLQLVNLLIAAGHRIEIETNGTVTPSFGWEHPCHAHQVLFNVSPKLTCSGVAATDAIKRDVLRRMVELGAVFKFVVQCNADVAEAAALVATVGIPPADVYLMPEGRSKHEILAALPTVFDACIEHGFNLTPRLQVLAFGNERGV